MQNNMTPPTPEEESLEILQERIVTMSETELNDTYKWCVLLLQKLVEEKHERQKTNI